MSTDKHEQGAAQPKTKAGDKYVTEKAPPAQKKGILAGLFAGPEKTPAAKKPSAPQAEMDSVEKILTEPTAKKAVLQAADTAKPQEVPADGKAPPRKPATAKSSAPQVEMDNVEKILTEPTAKKTAAKKQSAEKPEAAPVTKEAAEAQTAEQFAEEPAAVAEKAAPATKAATEKVPPAKPAAPRAKREPIAFFTQPLWQSWLRPIAALAAICLAVSLLLGITNAVTKGKIAQNALLAAETARRELLPSADTFEDITPQPLPEGILTVFKAANDAGYVIEAYGTGYAGSVPAMVAFNADGLIVGVKFLDNNETPGLGQNLKTQPAFANQFIGHPATAITLAEIDALAGATLSSMGALSAVNTAVQYYASLTSPDASGYEPPEGVLQTLWPAAAAWTRLDVAGISGILAGYRGDDGIFVAFATARGMSDVTVAVAMDTENAIAALWADTDTETDGYGRPLGNDPDFIGQFVGLQSADEVDNVAGVSLTVGAVKQAVNAALAALPALRQAPEYAGAEPSTPAYDLPAGVLEALWPAAQSWEKLALAAEGVLAGYIGDDGTYVLVASAPGFGSDVTAAVAVNADGVIQAVWLDTSGETDGYGLGVGENEAFLASFLGETSADGADAVAGASATEQAAKTAVNAALAALPQAKEAAGQ